MNRKKCPRCGVRRRLTEYNNSKRTRTGLRCQCKHCEREQARAFYYKHPEPYKERAYRQRDAMQAHFQKFMDFVKTSYGCLFCGEHLLCILDLHHYDYRKRNRPISRALHYGRPKFEKEINKCLVTCCNCHRKIHAGILVCTKQQRLNLSVPRLGEPIKIISKT